MNKCKFILCPNNEVYCLDTIKGVTTIEEAKRIFNPSQFTFSILFKDGSEIKYFFPTIGGAKIELEKVIKQLLENN